MAGDMITAWVLFLLSYFLVSLNRKYKQLSRSRMNCLIISYSVSDITALIYAAKLNNTMVYRTNSIWYVGFSHLPDLAFLVRYSL